MDRLQCNGRDLCFDALQQPQEMSEGEIGSPQPEPEASDEEIVERPEAMVPADSPVDAETLVARGLAADAMIQAVRDTRCDLIVMGTHGRKGFGRLFHASVTDHVTRAAPCPVPALRTA